MHKYIRKYEAKEEIREEVKEIEAVAKKYDYSMLPNDL